MGDFRQFLHTVEDSGELIRISQAVDAQYELGGLLQQAEARRKAILFESVNDSPFCVAGSLLTSPARFGMALNHPNKRNLSQAEHAELIRKAIQTPVARADITAAPCKHSVLTGDSVNCESLPVATFFEEDSGPFLTAAVGICRNPDNGVINAGFYRVLMLGKNSVAVSASPSSGLHGFMRADAEAGRSTHIALAIGMEPALLMAAAAKVPANISELDVAGALQGSSLETTKAECSDLPVPANAEFIIEVEIDHSESIDNTMGEFGDLYGTQVAPVGQVKAITHREDPIFHVIMAGAGKEHNTLGLIILYEVEPELTAKLQAAFPDVQSVRVIHDPPRMGAQGDVYVRMRGGRSCPAAELVEFAYSLNCGQYPIARTIRRVILVDEDIDINLNSEVNWAIATRATHKNDYLLNQDIKDSGGAVRIGIDARSHDAEQTKRLIIPGANKIELDDYK
jgi:2,5-furandicarboxylate decarboxylase 1